MAEGGGGGNVGEAHVEIIADIVVTDESIEAAEGKIQAALGKDVQAGGGGTGASGKADVQVDPAALHTKIAKAISTGDDFEISIAVDTLDIRKQIQEALSTAFSITVTAEMAGGERLASIGTAHGPMVSTGAPVSRGLPPEELRSLERKYGEAIENLYTQVASSVKGFAGVGPGAGTFDKLASVMQHFNATKFEDLLQVDKEAKGFQRTTGGALSPQALMAQGVPKEEAESLESAARAFTGERAGRYSDSGAQQLIVRMNKWMEAAPLVPQPAAAQQPVAPVTQPIAAGAVRTPPVERQAAGQEALRAQLEETVAGQAEAREGIIAEGQRALRGRPINVEAFETPRLVRAEGAGSTRQPNVPKYPGVVELSGGTTVEKLPRAPLTPGQVETLGEHPDFKAWVAEQKRQEEAAPKAAVAPQMSLVQNLRPGPGEPVSNRAVMGTGSAEEVSAMIEDLVSQGVAREDLITKELAQAEAKEAAEATEEVSRRAAVRAAGDRDVRRQTRGRTVLPVGQMGPSEPTTRSTRAQTQTTGGAVPEEVTSPGVITTRQGGVAAMGEQAGAKADVYPDVVPEDKLRQERLLGDWMSARGLRPRGDVIRPAGATGEIDLEKYMRAAEAGEFEDVFERFEKEKVKGEGGKTKTLTVSRGLEKMEPTDVAGFAELQRQRGLTPGVKRDFAGREGEGTFARVQPMEAMTRTIIRDAGVEEDSPSADTIRAEVEARATAIRGSLQQGQRAFAGPQSGPKIGMGAASDLGRLPKIVMEWQDHIDGEINKLGSWISTAEEQLSKTKSKGARTAIEGKIGRWRGFQREWQNKQEELADVADQLLGNASASDEQAIEMIRATHEAARARGEGHGQEGVVPNMVGLNLREQTRSEVGGFDEEGKFVGGGGGRLSGQARGRMYNILKQLGMAPPTEDSEFGPSVQTLLTGRFLSDPTRRALPSGGQETSLQALKRAAFGETGKPIKKPTEQNAGGLLQDLMSMMPEGTPKGQVEAVREGATDLLQGVIQTQADAIERAAKELDRKETTARPKTRGRTTASAIVTDEEIKRLTFDRQVTGEGQFKGAAPGVEGRMAAMMERNRQLKAEAVEQNTTPEKLLARRIGARGEMVSETPYFDPDDKRQVEFQRAREVAREAEQAKERLARDKTLGKGSTVTGAESQEVYREAGVMMPEAERPEPAFANLAEKLENKERERRGEEPLPVAAAAGGAGDRPPRGRVATGATPEEPRRPGSPGEVSGAIHVIVDGQPIQVTWHGASPTAGGGTTESNRRSASASRGSWSMADLGEQTSPEFQDAFRMEVERLVKAGTSEKGIKDAAKAAHLEIASAMFFGDRKRAAAPGAATPLGASERTAAAGAAAFDRQYGQRDPLGTRRPERRPPTAKRTVYDIHAEREARIGAVEAEAPFKAASDRAKAEERLAQARAKEAEMPFRAASDRAKAEDRMAKARAREAEMPFRAASDRARAEERLAPSRAATAQAPFEAASGRARAAEQAERQRQADQAKRDRDIRSSVRQARQTNPVEFSTERDISDDELAKMRGQNRALQRRVPRRGFGASLTDLITSMVPGGGALEKQLEASDRAQRELNEINQAAEKRSGLRVQRRGVLREAAALPAGSEKRLALEDQGRQLAAAAAQQTAIIKTSSRVFDENAKIVRKNTAAAFGAAAIGSVGSIGIGALTFGLGSAIAAPIITAVAEGVTQVLGPAIERFSGFQATTSRTTSAAADEIRARGGDRGAVAGIAARTGLGPEAFEQFGPLVTRRAEVEAGNKALEEQIGFMHAAQNLARDAAKVPGGVDRGLLATTGGMAGGSIMGIPATAELLKKELAANAPGIIPSEAPPRTGLEPLDDALEALGDFTRIGPVVDAATGDIAGVIAKNKELALQLNDTMGMFNENAERGGESTLKLTKATDAQAKASADLARQVGLHELAGAMEEGDVALTGARSGQDFLRYLASANRGATAPSPELMLEDTARARLAKARLQDQQREFQVEKLIPQGEAMGLAMQGFGTGGPQTAAAGINLGGVGTTATKSLNAELAETQKMYAEINKEVDIGIKAAKDFVSSKLDVSDPGAGAEFAKNLDLAVGYAKEIASIQIGIQTKQAAFQAAQFSYQIGIAKRNLQDAKGLAGQITDAGKDNLGVLEREQFFLQRRAQAMQLELSQRQINFQRSVAGFTAPGLTGEERAARIKQAKIEAEYAQKQLDIQKKLFGLSGRQFTIQASRAVTDLIGQLALLERGRVLNVETAVAEKRIRALTIQAERHNKVAQAYYEEAIARTNDLMQAEADLVANTQASLIEITDAVIEAFVKTYTAINNTLPGGSGGNEGTGPAAPGFINPNVTTNAEGALFMTAGATGMGQYGVAGEAGGEAIAILRDPKQLMTPLGGGGGGGQTTIQIIVQGNKFTSEEDEARVMRKITQAVKDAQDRDFALRGLKN